MWLVAGIRVPFFLLAISFLFPAPGTLYSSELVPAGARIIFEDDFSQPVWQGAGVEEGAAYGIEGRVLVPESFHDTILIQRKVEFALDEESFLRLDFRCAGYERLRILAFREGEDLPKSVLVTHFPSGEIQRLDIPVDGNFHNYHWRPGDYGVLKAGDRISRLAFEFTLTEKADRSVALGKVTVYSLTGEVHAARFKEALGQAREAVAGLPESLAGKKNKFQARLDELESLFNNPPEGGSRPVRELAAGVSAVCDGARRINAWYEPACKASRLPEVDYCVGSETSLRRVTHTNERLRFSGEVPAKPEISLARGEHEAFQIVILPFDTFLRNVRVQASDLLSGQGERIGREYISLGLVKLVRTQFSPHSNGTDLGWVPDPVCPLKDRDGFDVSPEAEIPVWVSVYAPRGTPAGTYSGTLTVAPENSHATLVPFKVTVWDYDIPARGMFRTQGHFGIEGVESFYNRKMDTRWLKEWYSFWLDYRFDPVGQYSAYLTPRPELIGFCLERGLNTINLGGFSGTGEVDRSAMDSVYSFIKDSGWLEYSYVYIGDETDNFALMRQKANLIHTRYPGVKVMIGGSIPRRELVGYIDVWDPIMRPGGVYGFEPGACREALARGEEVLWYVCIAPHPPYPNVQMEDPLVDCRSLFWMTYKYDIMGYEYWGYNFWEKNTRPSGEPRWPEIDWNSYAYDHTNGDGQLCYPGPEGLPWPSVRLAVNRDGIEDWEALWIMEDLARTAGELKLPETNSAVGLLVSHAREMADIPSPIVRDLTHYTKDPKIILESRYSVSQIITSLQQAIGKERAEEYRQMHIRERKMLEQKSLQRNIARARREMK
ncbi:MAG TPA: glycoside hydrolase domain-containing protein [archaeon]|nr:glycoside hydrolase domain-containing protein [archaeon]